MIINIFKLEKYSVYKGKLILHASYSRKQQLSSVGCVEVFCIVCVKNIVVRVIIIFLLLTPKIYMNLSEHSCKSKCSGNILPSLYNLLQYLVSFCPVFSYLPSFFYSVKKNIFVFFQFQKRVTRIFDFILMNGKTADSLVLRWIFFFIIIILI